MFEKLMRENKNGAVELCHCLHFLQMATEKLAKSFLCHTYSGPPKTTHAAQVKFLQSLSVNPSARLKYKARTNRDLASAIRLILPFAQQIQDLAPTANTSVLNAEYPWVDALGIIHCPSSHNYPHFNWTKLLQFSDFIKCLLICLK
ncbi:MAG: hypothetical protein WCG04_00500 [Alphaproteobacteria bacterium]